MNKKDTNSIDDYGIDFERVVELISKYEQIKKSGEIKRYNEESTKKDFIQPLFESLGWNFSNRGKSNDSVSAEETISKKRVDYGFRISGIPKFFLEAKSLKEENTQTNHKYITQAIDYAWMKSCSWAILTNFETIAVYNADWKESNYRNNLFFVLHPSDFLTDKRFTYLSKGALENNVLDNEASKYGKKQLKNPINKQLLQDMIHFREVLSKDIVMNNQDKHLNQDDIDESVQRILDRLIFIRNAEDRGLEENQLQSNVRQWYAKGKGHLVKEISGIYKDYDSKYNSKLFAHHLCDDLYIENEALQEVIEGLNQSKDNSYRYDFSIIESDVLGNIYEQYLGNILKSTPKRAKLEESKTHRKEQGIYYTPSYIVDYIVKNTVGEFIKTHTPEEIRNVRILDPACGSGSFLIRAYRELENYWKQNSDFAQLTLDSEEFYSKKVEILKNNIFGVDLDPKAVEIAQLNLLLQISEKKQRLPLLQNNIKVGNSLIDDPTVSDRAFKWEEGFPEIIDKGGFDIVIGNPPYVRQEELSNFKPYLSKNYNVHQGTADLFVYFFERELNLLKDKGYFGMIVSNKWLRAGYGKNLRGFLSNFWIEEFVDFGDLRVFPDATTYPSIILVKKLKKRNPKLRVCKMEMIPSGTIEEYVKDHSYTINGEVLSDKDWIVQRKEGALLLNKIRSIGIPLEKFVGSKIFRGILTGFNEAFIIDEAQKQYFCKQDGINKEIIKPFLTGAEVKRYRVESKNNYIILTKTGIDIEKYPMILEHLNKYKKTLEERWDKGKYWYELRGCSYYGLFEKPKIVWGNLSTKASFAFDSCDNFYVNAPACILPTDSKFVLGLLNSSLISYFLKSICAERQGGFIEQKPIYVAQVPIKKPTEMEEQTMTNLVDKMLMLNRHLVELLDKETDRKNSIEDEIEEVDRRIDELVYRMYNINGNEREIIER